MKSSLKIGLGLGNEPVIDFNIFPSDDIRDQLCCQFLERLGHTSTTCSVSILPGGEIGKPTTHRLIIAPVSPIIEGDGHWQDQLEFITSLRAIEHTIREQRNLGWVNMLVGGDIVYWENAKTLPSTYSQEYSRKALSLLHRDALVRKVMEILDGIDTWQTSQALKLAQ